MLKKLIAAAAVVAACAGAAPVVAASATPAAVVPAPEALYPNNALKWQIKVLAPIGWKPFAYSMCLDATADKIVWLRVRHYHYFVVERCISTLDGYFRSTIRYWYVY